MGRRGGELTIEAFRPKALEGTMFTRHTLAARVIYGTTNGGKTKGKKNENVVKHSEKTLTGHERTTSDDAPRTFRGDAWLAHVSMGTNFSNSIRKGSHRTVR